MEHLHRTFQVLIDYSARLTKGISHLRPIPLNMLQQFSAETELVSEGTELLLFFFFSFIKSIFNTEKNQLLVHAS